jgi:hypothetical protein
MSGFIRIFVQGNTPVSAFKKLMKNFTWRRDGNRCKDGNIPASNSGMDNLTTKLYR